MKKTILILFTCFATLILAAQPAENAAANAKKHTLLLMNPTARNLQTICFLMDNQLLSLPADYRLLGFYSKAQAYDFQESRTYIREAGKLNITLMECAEQPGEAVYGENPCSADFSEAFANSDGVVFFGGPDIPPSLYGQKTNLLTEITDYHRHTFEASFLFHLLGGHQNEAFKPLLEQNPEYLIVGICLGMQTMNVATGGTLIQDIPTQIYGQSTVEQALDANADDRHRNYYTNLGLDNDLIWGHFHRIKITADKIQAWIPPSDSTHPFVLSSHHQAAGSIGKGLVVAATGMDGKVVEIMIHEKYPNVIGFQFHPEPTYLYRADQKLNFQPLKPANQSYIDLYGGASGEHFNRNIWNWIGETLMH
jgi:putative glutamine amidotransferase